MAEVYKAYATEVSNALQRLMESTGVSLHPAGELVSCNSGLHEHFVPADSLEEHLRKCHGEKKPRPITNSAFYYHNRAIKGAQQTEGSGKNQLEAGDGGGDQEAGTDCGERSSLLEPDNSDVGNEETENAGHDQGIINAIERVPLSAGEFYAQVQSWQRIPRTYATMTDTERDLVTPSALRRWLNAELSRPGMFPSGDALDEELVEFVAGLLDHPDFCQPDLLALELHEFLGSSVTGFVLTLWKFLVVEIGLRSAFKDEGSRLDKKLRADPASVYQSTVEKTPQNPDNKVSTIAERDYKRRRASYRGNIGTKTGVAAFREMIQKHMVGLSLETGRNLALGGGYDDETPGDSSKQAQSNQLRPECMEWYRFTDALEVRNRGRPRDKDSSMRVRGRSSSLLRGRSVQRDMQYRGKQKSMGYDGRSERGRRQRRSRSRSQSHRRPHQRGSESYQRSRRKRSASTDRNHQRSHRHHRSEDRRR